MNYPKDVTQTAREAYRSLVRERDWPGPKRHRLAEIAQGKWDGGITLRVAARAIMAERERCATLIERRAGSIPDRQEIAREIRLGLSISVASPGDDE